MFQYLATQDDIERLIRIREYIFLNVKQGKGKSAVLPFEKLIFYFDLSLRSAWFVRRSTAYLEVHLPICSQNQTGKDIRQRSQFKNFRLLSYSQ